jgi:hypothetical protein
MFGAQRRRARPDLRGFGALNAANASLSQWYSQAFPAGNGPNGVAFDGCNVWVTDWNGATVTKPRAGTGAVLGTYAVGTNPVAAAFDGSNIWVVNQDSNSVTKLLASTGGLLGTYAAGAIR